MADKEIYNQCSLDQLQSKENQFPKISCKIHENLFYEAISLNSSYNNAFVCMKCIISDDLNGKQLIFGEDFFTKNQNQIIKNWPPLQNSQLPQLLMNKDVQEYNHTEIAFKITQLFDELKCETIKTIDDHLKRILSHINIVEEKRENAFQIYNQMAEKDEIRKQISENQNDLNLLEQYLKTTINKKQEQLKENEKILKDSLDTLSTAMQKIKFDHLQNVTNQFLMKLKSTDFLNYNFTEEIQKESNLLSKVNRILGFVSNKNNFCSEKFLNQLKDILLENKQIFSQLNFSEFNFQEIQPNQSSQLFKQNSIFDVQIQQPPSPLFSNVADNLLKHIKIIKSQFGDQNFIFHKLQESGKIEIHLSKNIFDQTRNSVGQIYIDKQILATKRYEIKLLVNNKILMQKKSFIIGLLASHNKDCNQLFDKLAISSCNNQSGIDKVETGKHISQIINDVTEITFQISINEKILRCLAMTKNQKNINSIQNLNYLLPNIEYYFFIQLSQFIQTVVISEFKTVKSFEEW